MKKILSNIATICLLLSLLQSCGWESSIKKGDESYALGEYYDAAKFYRKAYTNIPAKERKKKGEIAYKMADCYRLTNYSVRAKAAYINAIRYKYHDSIALFYLAELQKETGDYKAAIKSYEQFLSYKPTNILAKNGLISCKLAPEWKKNPTRYIVKPFPLFLSNRSEYSPMYAGKDIDQIYFTSTRDKAKGNNLNGITGMKSADIFLAKKNEKGNWLPPERLESEVNTEFEDGACSFTADGKTMYFTRCRIDANAPVSAEIYVSQRTGANWGSPQKCIITKDTLSSLAHPAISPDGHFLYFSSDMPGGYGEKDIWRVPVSNSGFGAVENLGDIINTPGDEMFPTIKDNGDLYFSSDGHPGMGGLDLYQAQQDSLGNWIVENLKSPMNSQSDDFGMTFEPGLQRGFFSSNRKDARGWDHIYTFELPEIAHTVTGWVYDKEGDALPEATVSIVGQDGTNLKVSVKGDGSFTQKLERGQSYIMLANCRGYLNCKKELTTDSINESKNYELEFPLASITRPVLIDNIFYEFDKATLTAESTKALNDLIKMLNDNPNITIELSAHCDYFGNDSYNEELSQRRAEAVVKFLVAGGIDIKRLTAKGYGESQPKIINKRIAKKYQFLKEGDVLTEDFILKLPAEQQEICNAMNRRTEFKVVRTTYKLYK